MNALEGNIFKFLDESSLKKGDFRKEHEFLIEGFLPEELITMIYSAGGSGKSFLSFAIAKRMCELGKKVFYLDFDNPVSVLKERHIDKLLIEKYENLRYIQRSSLQIPPFDLVMHLEASAIKGMYKDCVFFLDSLINFCDLFNDNRLMRLFDALKNMREAGATIIVLHHANKDGKNYQGSTCIRNAIDCMYKLNQRPANENELNFFLEVQKERASIIDNSFCLDVTSLDLPTLEKDIAMMSEYEFGFSAKAVKLLKEQESLNKTEFLSLLGHEKDDKTARECLDKFDGKLWYSQKVGKSIFYSYKKPNHTSTIITTIAKEPENLLFDSCKIVGV